MYKSLFLALLAVSPELCATLSWSQPQTVSSKGAVYPRAVVDAEGNATVAWFRPVSKGIVLEVSEQDQGVWSDPKTVSKLSMPDQDRVYFPELQVDRQGQAIMVWSQGTASGADAVFVSHRKKGEAWSKPYNLSQAMNRSNWDAVSPKLAMNEAGRAAVLWSVNDRSSRSVIQATLKEAHGEHWSEPTYVSELVRARWEIPMGVLAGSPCLAMDPDGNVVAAWLRTEDKIQEVPIQSAVQLCGEPWTRALDVSLVQGLFWPKLVTGERPRIAMNAQGQVALSWVTNGWIYVATKEAEDEGAWPFPAKVVQQTPNDELCLEHHISIDERGAMTLVTLTCEKDCDLNFYIRTAHKPAQGTWSTPTLLAGPLTGEESQDVPLKYLGPAIAKDAQGRVTAIWGDHSAPNHPNSVLYAASQDERGNWSRPVALTSGETEKGRASIVPGPDGSMMAVWEEGPHGSQEIHVATGHRI